MCEINNINELSYTAEEFIDLVKYSKIAPYKIKGSWWLISGSICRQCEDTSIITLQKSNNGEEKLTEPEMAERLWKVFTEMKTVSYTPSRNETAELKELYEKVQRMDVSYEESTHAKAKNALEKLLQSLSDSEIEELIKQRDELPKLIDYTDGCSYRHRSSDSE